MVLEKSQIINYIFPIPGACANSPVRLVFMKLTLNVNTTWNCSYSHLEIW